MATETMNRRPPRERPSGVPERGLGASRGELIGFVVAVLLTTAIVVAFFLESTP